MAQHPTNGHVQDKSNSQPIESAYVTLNHAPDSVIVAFARTDAAGAFTLTFAPDSGQVYYLSVSHISYQTTTQPLPADARLPITIEMEPGSLILNEVQITARVPVREQGDSTRFKVDAFRNGSEQNLEEVLRKMPNVRVDDNGDIYFKNRKVDKVLLDGDDLVGNAYQLATRSINPAVLNEVQAIEHYSENRLLRQVEQSDKTVLNLTVKDDRKTLLFGSVDAVGGPDQYNGTANLFSYRQRVKAFSVLSANNVGIKRLDLTDAGASVLPDDRPATDQTIRSFLQTAQPFARYLNNPLENLNQERVGTLNVAATPVKSLKITANLTGFQDQVRASRQQIYQTLGDTPFAYQQADTLRQRPQLLHLRVQAVYDWSARTTLIYKGIVATKIIDLNQRTGFVSGTDSQLLPQQFGNQLTDSQHALEWTHKPSPVQAWQAALSMTDTRLTERLQTALSSSLGAALFGQNPASFGQVLTQHNRVFGGQLKWLYGTKKRKFEEQVGFARTDFSLSNHQTINGLSLLPDSLPVINQTVFGRSSFRFVGRKLDLSGFVRFDYRTATIGRTDYGRAIWQGNVATSWKLNRLNTLALSFDHQATPITPAYMLNRYVATDFRTAQRGTAGFFFDERDQLALSYIFSDIAFHKMTLVATAFASRGNSYWGLSDYQLFPDYALYRLLNTPGVLTTGLNVLMDKLIYPLSGNIRLDVKLLRTEFPQVVDGKARTVIAYQPTVSAKYISVFESPFNLEIGGTYRYSSQAVVQAETRNTQAFRNVNVQIQVFYRQKSYQVNVTAENYWLQENRYFFLKANATYHLNPRLTFRLDAANLLNQNSFRQVSLSPVLRSEGSYPLLGRIVTLGGRYSF